VQPIGLPDGSISNRHDLNTHIFQRATAGPKRSVQLILPGAWVASRALVEVRGIRTECQLLPPFVDQMNLADPRPALTIGKRPTAPWVGIFQLEHAQTGFQIIAAFDHRSKAAATLAKALGVGIAQLAGQVASLRNRSATWPANSARGSAYGH